MKTNKKSLNINKTNKKSPSLSKHAHKNKVFRS